MAVRAASTPQAIWGRGISNSSWRLSDPQQSRWLIGICKVKCSGHFPFSLVWAPLGRRRWWQLTMGQQRARLLWTLICTAIALVTVTSLTMILMQKYAHEIHPCCFMYQWCVHFHGCVEFHQTSISHSIYSSGIGICIFPHVQLSQSMLQAWTGLLAHRCVHFCWVDTFERVS